MFLVFVNKQNCNTCGFMTLSKTRTFVCSMIWNHWPINADNINNEQAEGTKCPCKSPAACSTIHVMHYACIARCIMSAELGLAWSPAPLGPITHRLASPTIQARAGHVRVVFFFAKCLFLSGLLLNKMGQFKFYRTYCWGDNASQRPKIYRQIKNILCLCLLSFWLWFVFYRCLLKMSSSRRNTHKVWPPVFNCISAQTAGLEREPEPRACRFINRNEQKHINSTSHMKLKKTQFFLNPFFKTLSA